MAKTINPDIFIFDTEAQARKKFNSLARPCHLLYSERYKAYYVDLSKTVIKEWPQSYTLIADLAFGAIVAENEQTEQNTEAGD